MAASSQPEQTSSRSAHPAQAARGQGGPPGGPPGFGALPAYMAQRLSSGPAPKSAELPNQAGSSRPRATSNSPDQVNNRGAGPNGRQHLPAAAYDASSEDSSDEEPPGFARASTTAGPREPAPAAGPNGLTAPEHGRQAPSQTQRAHPLGYRSGSTVPPDRTGSHQVGTCFASLQFNCASVSAHVYLSNAYLQA